MSHEEEELVKAHLHELTRRAEGGDTFAIRTLGVIVFLMEMAARGPDDDGGSESREFADNIIHLFGRAA
jgi:hypothetical protein